MPLQAVGLEWMITYCEVDDVRKISFCLNICGHTLPSVLWRCWLGDRKGIRPVKNWVAVACFSKIQIGFTFLVPAHPGSPGKRAVKRVCVCVCVCVWYSSCEIWHYWQKDCWVQWEIERKKWYFTTGLITPRFIVLFRLLHYGIFEIWSSNCIPLNLTKTRFSR